MALTNLRITRIGDLHGRAQYEVTVDSDDDPRGSVVVNLMTWNSDGTPVSQQEIVDAKKGTNRVHFNPIPMWALTNKVALVNARVATGPSIGIAVRFDSTGATQLLG